MYPGAVVAYSACLESHGGAACTFATGGLPAVVHRGALSGDEMRLIASQHGQPHHARLASARIWLLRLIRTRLSALGDTPRGWDRATGRPATTAPAARASPLQSRRFHRLWPPRLRSHTRSVICQGTMSIAHLAWVATRRDTS